MQKDVKDLQSAFSLQVQILDKISDKVISASGSPASNDDVVAPLSGTNSKNRKGGGSAFSDVDPNTPALSRNQKKKEKKRQSKQAKQAGNLGVVSEQPAVPAYTQPSTSVASMLAYPTATTTPTSGQDGHVDCATDSQLRADIYLKFFDAKLDGLFPSQAKQYRHSVVNEAIVTGFDIGGDSDSETSTNRDAQHTPLNRIALPFIPYVKAGDDDYECTLHYDDGGCYGDIDSDIESEDDWETEILFLRPDGATEIKSPAWCASQGFPQLGDGLFGSSRVFAKLTRIKRDRLLQEASELLHGTGEELIEESTESEKG